MKEVHRRRLAILVAAGAVLALASCGSIPPPTPAPAPPAGGGRPVPPAPPPPAPAPAPLRLDREPELDIGIGLDVDKATIVPKPMAQVSTRSTETLRTERNVQAPLTVELTSGGFRCSWKAPDGTPVQIAATAGETLWIEPAGTARIGWNDKTWRGRFKVFRSPRGKLTIAARVPLEAYLLGVVPGEIGALSEALLQAGRAQAIAARSYSLFYRGRRLEEGFDLFGTVEDQVYGPVESERPFATRCVESTRGEMALHGGAPIRANYCSTCGGITADVWEGWPTAPLPYLVGHRDRDTGQDYCVASPQYRWREEWTAAEFLDTVLRQAAAEGISAPLPPADLVDVRAESRSRSGRVWRLTVLTTRGSIVIPAYRLRWVLRRPANPTSILRSTLFKIDVKRDPATRKALRVIASGAGSGHGVGLCQTGALGMARAGVAADRILRHYYRGIELKRMY